MMKFRTIFILLVGITLIANIGRAGTLGTPDSPDFLRDRGLGVATSRFGTYVSPGELLIYTSFKHSQNRAFEYSPNDFGFNLELKQDFEGDYRASKGALFLGYGLTNSLAVEVEAAVIKASLRKPDEDTSPMPTELRESGLGDVQAHVTWRCLMENDHRPEGFVFLGTLFPHDRQKYLIGTSGLRLLPGIGVVRGFHWGTLAARAGLEYDFGSDSPFDWGKWSLEYLRRVSRAWQISVALDGQIGGGNNFDELWLVTGMQWEMLPHVALKLSNSLGLGTRSSGWSPEIGVMINLPLR